MFKIDKSIIDTVNNYKTNKNFGYILCSINIGETPGSLIKNMRHLNSDTAANSGMYIGSTFVYIEINAYDFTPIISKDDLVSFSQYIASEFIGNLDAILNNPYDIYPNPVTVTSIETKPIGQTCAIMIKLDEIVLDTTYFYKNIQEYISDYSFMFDK